MQSEYGKYSPFDSIIERIEYLSDHNSAKTPKSYKLFADGYVGLVYYESESDLLFNAVNAGRLFLFGQTVLPLEIKYSSGFALQVFYFKPYALKYLFDVDANELTDTCLDFDLIDPDLKGRLSGAKDNDERIAITSRFIVERQRRLDKDPDERIVYATRKIMGESGNLSLTSLRNEIYVTERTFERQFLRNVGISPMQFAKICRFRKAINEMSRDESKNLTEIAYVAGYADQPHFIRHFREFTSMTPSQYLKLLNRNSFSESFI